MTSPYYQPQGGFGDPQFDRDQAARMYDLQTQMKLKELEQQYKLSKDEIGARLKIAGQQSKDTRYGIDAQRDSEREKLAQVKDEMERIGIPDMLIRRYVAEKTYEIALSEMTLKRDVFVEETAQAREKLKLDREEMERIGIPDMEIRRYVAQQEAAIARGQLGLQQGELTGYYNGQSTLSRDQFRSEDEYRRAQADEARRQFNVSQTGYMQQPGQLTAEQRGRYEQIRARDAELRAGGEAGVTAGERAELAGYEDILSGRAGGSQGQATMDRERLMMDEAERQRRYALDVGKFGAELASRPDTYFQARRFQGVDVPRLLGGAGVATNDVQGGPTPGVATMGAYLSGQDPYGPQPEQSGWAPGSVPGAPAPSPSAPYSPSPLPVAPTPAPAAQPLSPQEQARFEQLVARARQLAAAGEPVPPADAAELAGYQSRAGSPAAPGYGSGLGPKPQTLSPQEQARFEQLVARRQQTGGVLDPVDEDELQRFTARGARPPGGPDMIAPHGPIDQDGNPIGGPSGGGGMTTGWYTGGPAGPDDPDRMIGITDPGYAPSSDPYGDRMRAMGGGIPGMGGPGGGGITTGWYDPTGQYGAGGGGGGGSYEALKAAGGGGYGEPTGFTGASLNSYSPTASVYGGPAVSASVGPQGYAMPSWYTQQQGRQSSPYPSQDPRQKQIAQIAKASPPSVWDGLNEQDTNTLKLMESVYKRGGQSLAGGEYERLASSGRLGFLQSAGRLLGHDPKELEATYKSYRPSQASSRMAG